MVKSLPTMQETWVQSLGWENLLEKEKATHSSILAWKILWMEEPGTLPSMGWHWTEQLHFHEKLSPRGHEGEIQWKTKIQHSCFRSWAEYWGKRGILVWELEEVISNLFCCAYALSRLTLCDPIDSSLPDSSVSGIFRVRILDGLNQSISVSEFLL